MNKHQRSIKPGLLAAAIAATVLVSAANGQAASSAGRADTVRGAPVDQDQRIPVVSLTGTMGDVGFEIFDGKTPRYNFATLPMNLDDAILYIDVDSPQWNTKKTRDALKLARDLGWVVMAESASWNVPRLHAFLATHFPDTNTRGLQNVAVRIGWSNGRADATDLTPSKAAVEVGRDYLRTSEGQALVRNTFATKTIAPGSKYAWFANNAYQATASRRTAEGRDYQVVLDRDVVKVWKSTSGYFSDCIIAWRGSHTTGDWQRNFQNQFGSLVAFPGALAGSDIRIGSGYATRLNNYRAAVEAVASNASCEGNFKVTGHSLGGAMAEVYAYHLRSRGPELEAYNPARVGNASFRVNLQGAVSPARLKVYCRHGDPVWSVPIGLEHVGTDQGCTYWGARASTLWPLTNHNMALWL
jgi:hypothetical protein